MLDFTGIDEEAYDWAGAAYFLDKTTGKGFYRSCDPSDTSVSCYSKYSTTPGGFTIPLAAQGEKGEPTDLECGEYWDLVLKPSLYIDFKINENYNYVYTHATVDKLLRLYLTGEEDPNDKPWYEDIADFGTAFASDPGGFVIAIIGQTFAFVGSLIAGLIKDLSIYITKLIIPITIAMTQALMIIFLPIVMIIAAFRIDFLIFYAMLYFSVAFTQVIIIIVSYLHEFVLQITTLNSNLGTAASRGKDNAMLTAAERYASSNFEYFLIDFMMLGLYAGAISLWVNLLKIATEKAYDIGNQSMNDLNVADSSINQGIGAIKGSIK